VGSLAAKRVTAPRPHRIQLLPAVLQHPGYETECPALRRLQTFQLPVRLRVRYLQLLFDTHYGSESMCALNSVEVSRAGWGVRRQQLGLPGVGRGESWGRGSR
jgi:hypothetical protein